MKVQTLKHLITNQRHFSVNFLQVQKEQNEDLPDTGEHRDLLFNLIILSLNGDKLTDTDNPIEQSQTYLG